MATQVYNEAKLRLAQGLLDGREAGTDIRIALLMTITNAGTVNDGVTNLDDITLDEHPTAGRQALANQTVVKDDANDRSEFDADDVLFASLAAGARDVDGVLVYEHVDGTDANDIPIAYLEYAQDKTPDGSDFTVEFDAEGYLQVA